MENNFKSQLKNGKQPEKADHTVLSSSASRQAIIPQKLIIALMLFTLTGSVYVWIAPNIARVFGNGTRPDLLQISLTGIVIIIFTSVLLNYTAKVIGLTRSWFLWAFLYNASIVIIKFIISPYSFYNQTFGLERVLDDAGEFKRIQGFNPNEALNSFTGLSVMILYLLVFGLIYLVYKKRLKENLSIESSSIKSLLKRKGKALYILLIILAISSLLWISGVGGWLALPGIIILGPFIFLYFIFSEYFSHFVAGSGLIAFIAILFAIISAAAAFNVATNTAIKMKDASILASFFWIGFSLIVIYHALWVVYIPVLISIWPFTTYVIRDVVYPSSK